MKIQYLELFIEEQINSKQEENHYEGINEIRNKIEININIKNKECKNKNFENLNSEIEGRRSYQLSLENLILKFLEG